MTDLKILEKKIKDLEDRVEKLEERILSPLYKEDEIYMDALYKKAEKLVRKDKNISTISLQRKLLIDFERVTRIWKELREKGVIK